MLLLPLRVATSVILFRKETALVLSMGYFTSLNRVVMGLVKLKKNEIVYNSDNKSFCNAFYLSGKGANCK
jgi:hypothetical protein